MGAMYWVLKYADCRVRVPGLRWMFVRRNYFVMFDMSISTRQDSKDVNCVFESMA